jgi:nucleotide-binding universal stress UspA family protein
MSSSTSFIVVVGFDGSRDSQAALEWAAEEARQRSGELRLITAWTKQPMSWYPAVMETAVGGIAVADSPQEDASTIQAKALKSLEEKGVSATGQVVHSHSAAAAILDAAAEADLVVVGSRGHGGFTGLHVGSVTTHVVNHAPAPVLVVRPKAS